MFMMEVIGLLFEVLLLFSLFMFDGVIVYLDKLVIGNCVDGLWVVGCC